MLLGIWKNIEDLENSINIDELQAFVTARREDQREIMKFQAALKGVDIDAGAKTDIKERFDEVKRRVESRQTGQSTEQIELADFGLDLEVE